MRLALALALVAATGGCKKDRAPAGSGSGSAGAVSTSAVGPCNDAINKSIDNLISAKRNQGSDLLTPERQERFERLRGVLGERCATDQWPVAMMTCVAGAAGQPDLMRCMHDHLDEPTQQRLSADIAKVMFGMRRNGAGGPAQGPGGVDLHARVQDFDVADAYAKRLAELTTKVDEAAKVVAAAKTEAERTAAKTELGHLASEKTRVERDLVQIKATHGGDLKDTTPSTTIPSSGSGSGSAAKSR